MAIATQEKLEVLDPPRTRRRYADMLRRPEAWYAVFTVYAAAVALFSGLGQDRVWGIWASGGYAIATLLAACWRSRLGRHAALAASLAGALAGPLTWLATQSPATPDVTVVMRSGVLLLHHGSPYLGSAQLAHGGWLAYNPYLPVMAIFGLPKALGWPGIAGDPRPWLAFATFGLLVAAFCAAGSGGSRRGGWHRGGSRRGGWHRAAFAVSSPVLAFPLAMGITDPPVIALTCLAIALAAHRSVTSAAIVIGVACAMKETAWPAAAVLAVMIAVRCGHRTAARFISGAAATALALTAALAPAALFHPGELIQNTIAYPLGLTAARSPAQSPLPGHLLATLGPAGHRAAMALLVTSMLIIAVSLLARPPATADAAAGRLAIALTLMFALCPATRFGYFAYPAALCGWLYLTRATRAYAPPPRLVTT
jgi:hypothetical protein